MLEGSSWDDRHLMPRDAEISVAEELIVVLKAFHQKKCNWNNKWRQVLYNRNSKTAAKDSFSY